MSTLQYECRFLSSGGWQILRCWAEPAEAGDACPDMVYEVILADEQSSDPVLSTEVESLVGYQPQGAFQLPVLPGYVELEEDD